ncbi:MAG TPA: DUF58 domain-containing protein, partial [Thermoanaerobaculia bacterium]|nr:DUF58 domain-containing protein [Thermoanaerobaculia bacterium]
MKRGRSTPEGIRITKVGLWFVLFTVLVAIAATNTGNNALYLVVSAMLATLVVSGVVSRQNVGGLDARLEVPGEVYANQPFSLEFALENRSRWLPRWFLLVSASKTGAPRLVPHLPRRGTSRGRLELLLPRRGSRTIPAVHVSSLFPFGFFRKGVRYHVDREVVVFPELYPAATAEVERTGRLGEVPVNRAGWGHDLHALRGFRKGDDPRGIHWKQTARTGDMVYMERQTEESRRLSILFDNGVGELDGEDDRERFERLVSEAATAAVDYLGRGFEVELVTRDRALPVAGGRRQRLAVLEHLALIEPGPPGGGPLRSRDPGAPQVR